MKSVEIYVLSKSSRSDLGITTNEITSEVGFPTNQDGFSSADLPKESRNNHHNH